MTPNWSPLPSVRRPSASAPTGSSWASSQRVLPGWFPHLPDQSQYNRRLRGLVGLMSIVQQRLARWLDAGGVRLADGTALAVASYPGCEKRSHFCRLCPLRIRQVPAPLPLGSETRASYRRARAAARLHRGARQREGVRAAGRSAHRHPGRGGDRGQGLLGRGLPRAAGGRGRESPHPGQDPHRRKTSAANGRSPPPGW